MKFRGDRGVTLMAIHLGRGEDRRGVPMLQPVHHLDETRGDIPERVVLNLANCTRTCDAEAE